MELTANAVKITRVYDQITPRSNRVRKTLRIESDLTLDQFDNEKQRKEYYYETVKANPIVITVDRTTSMAKIMVRLDKKTDWVYTQFRNIKCGWKLGLVLVVWELARRYVL